MNMISLGRPTNNRKYKYQSTNFKLLLQIFSCSRKHSEYLVRNNDRPYASVAAKQSFFNQDSSFGQVIVTARR